MNLRLKIARDVNRRRIAEQVKAELAEARSLLETIANSTEHADAAQKWECEKAELVNGLRKIAMLHLEHYSSNVNKAMFAETKDLIAKYEAK
jgi:hypothetical protein